jgi:NAD(P)-dependent dehydrogenase (short-subunit alcohol dehydrogenase family)
LGCNDGFGSAKEDIELAAQEAGRSAPRVLCLTLDVTDSTSVAAAAATIRSVVSGLDVLVNNAGFMTPALPVTEADEELWWKTLEVNLKGVFLVSKHFTPLLVGKENGLKTMVNINSVAAHNLRPNASAYGISKWSVLKFTEFLLVEQAKQGLLAFSVHPGAIMTELALAMPKETHASEYYLSCGMMLIPTPLLIINLTQCWETSPSLLEIPLLSSPKHEGNGLQVGILAVTGIWRNSWAEKKR